MCSRRGRGEIVHTPLDPPTQSGPGPSICRPLPLRKAIDQLSVSSPLLSNHSLHCERNSGQYIFFSLGLPRPISSRHLGPTVPDTH